MGIFFEQSKRIQEDPIHLKMFKENQSKIYEYVMTHCSQLLHSQDEDSGHRILRDPAGKMRKSRRIPQESTGNGSSIPAGSFSDFFPVSSCEFPVLSGRKRSEIIGKNPKKFRLEYCFHLPVCFRWVPVECAGNALDPAGSCRTSLSWVTIQNSKYSQK